MNSEKKLVKLQGVDNQIIRLCSNWTWFDKLFCMSDDNNSGNSHQIDFSEQEKTRQISMMLRILMYTQYRIIRNGI